MSNLHYLVSLKEKFGADCTIGEVVRQVQGKNIHQCPKCGGVGSFYIPESYGCDGQEYHPAKNIECDLCKGIGYTDREYRPKMVQKGWA